MTSRSHGFSNISERLISIFVNLMILAVRIYMLLFFIYALVETGYQLIDFLFSGDLHSTSLSVRLGAVSDTQLLGWNKMMNWLFDLHIVFVFMIVLLASLAGEFFLAKFIKHDRRWRNDVAFFASRK